MKIFDNLVNLFKKKENNVGIINISDLFYIPRLEEMEDEKIKKSVLMYIDEYKEKLSNRKNLSSLDLKVQEISDKINMCTDIILNMCMKNDLESPLMSLSNIYLIESAKLKYYESVILENKFEIYARLIATKHIYGTKLISPSKRKILKNLYNNLVIAHNIVASQNYSIKSIIDNYLNKVNLNEEKQNLDLYKKSVYDIAMNIIPEIYNNVINSDISEISKIVSLEISLEKYIYNNKDVFKTFNKDELEQKNILDAEKILKKQEIILKAFIYYGRNYITEEEIINFYRTKFNFLCNIVNEKNFSNYLDIEKLGTIEFKVYEEEIYKRIERMVNGISNELINLPNDIKIKCIKLLNNVFKLDGVYEASCILNDCSLFFLLISLEQKDGINNFFDKCLVNTNWLKKNYIYGDYIDSIKFELEEKINFKCLNFISKSLNINSKNSMFESSSFASFKDYNKYILLFELYILCEENGILSNYVYDVQKNINFYKLPEGLKALTLFKNKNILFKDERNDACGEKLMESEGFILPSTLLKFKYNDCNQILHLNKKLKILDLDKWVENTLKISPNLMVIKIDNAKNIRIIKFKNFENSLILKNDKRFSDFMLQFYQWEIKEPVCFTGYNYFKTPPEMYESVFEKHFYKTNLEQMIFESSNCKSLIINGDEMNINLSVDTIDSWRIKFYQGKADLYFSEVIRKIKLIVEEKTGYIIGDNSTDIEKTKCLKKVK